MKVKIVKCSHPQYWYASEIGQYFDVEIQKGDKGGYWAKNGIMGDYVIKKGEVIVRFIDKKDALTIPELREKKLNRLLND